MRLWQTLLSKNPIINSPFEEPKRHFLYVRDPVGNMVEVNRRDVSTLDRFVVDNIKKVEAGDEGATLYLGKR